MGISLMNIKSCLGTKVVGGRNVHKLNGLFGEEEEEEEEETRRADCPRTMQAAFSNIYIWKGSLN